MTNGVKPARITILYVATNLINGNEYIGVTCCSIAKRRREHFCGARTGSRIRFHNAIRKYGEENFEFKEIERRGDYASALKREVELISARKPVYNLTAGGDGTSGFKMPLEAVEKNAAKKRGSVGYWRGKKRPPDTVEKMRLSKLANPTRYWLGKKRSQESIDKIRLSKTGVPRKPVPPHALAIYADNMRRAAAARRRPVRCIDDGVIYSSAKDAAEKYGLKTLSINQVCMANSKRKTLFGRRFEYLTDMPT